MKKETGFKDPVSSRWDARIQRARRLVPQYPPASHALEFYAMLAAVQQSILSSHGHAIRRRPLFIDSLDCAQAAGALPELLSALSRNAPAKLAALAAVMSREDAETLHTFVENAWQERLRGGAVGG